MRVRSKLADIEFLFGAVERKGNDLVIHSHPDQRMKSRVFITPADVLTALWALFRSPGAWVFVLGFPVFYFRARRGKPAVKKPA